MKRPDPLPMEEWSFFGGRKTVYPKKRQPEENKDTIPFAFTDPWFRVCLMKEAEARGIELSREEERELWSFFRAAVKRWKSSENGLTYR